MARGLTGWFTRLVLLGFTSFALIPVPSQAQAPAANAAAISGQVSAPLGSLAVSAQVRICPITASLAPCTPTAQLFTNSALTVALPNPISTDQYGNYKAFVAAGLYLVQVTVTPGLGPTYTYYVSAGSSNSGGGSSPPAYSVQFASPTAGQFASDPTIFINPTQHIFEAPEVFVPGTGTGLIGIAGSGSGNFVNQTVDANTAGWTFTWPTTQPTSPGTNCIVAPAPLSGTIAVASWQSCILAGQFLPLSGGTLTGPLVGTSANFQTTNTVVNAALDPTAGDIGAKINHAISACPTSNGNAQCQIYVPAGLYPYTTTISLPLGTFGTLGLTLDPGAILQYTGAGDAVLTRITSNPTIANLIIQGGTILGNSSATAGIHLKPSQKITIRNVAILEFLNGDAIYNEGANAINIYDNDLQNNQNGVHLVSTFCNAATPVVCSTAFSAGQAFSSNAVHIFQNNITVNSHWGIWDEWNGLAGATGSLNNHFLDNDLELNGFGAGNGNFGAVFVMKSVGDVIANNYFEGSPREVVLGQLTGGAGDFFAASGPIVRDNYFTTSPPISGRSQSFNIELQNVTDTLIEGNSEQGSPGIGPGTNCFINASTNGETRTVISRNAIFQNSGAGSGNAICVNGAGSFALAGAGSFTIQNPAYLSQIEFQGFNVNQAVTSESIAVAGLSGTGSCDIRPIASNSTAAANGLTTILAGTTKLTGLSTGAVSITHPSGQAISVDLYCALGPFNGYGTP